MGVIQINIDPSRRQLNQFGLIWMAFFAALGGVLWYKLHSLPTSVTVWTVAVAVPLVGWAVPAFMRVVYVGMSYLAWPIGFVISHVVLALVYYLVFTVVGLIMRVLGYDPMARRFDPQAASYWHRRQPGEGADTRRYFRQF
jgi:hypothetical protein